MTRYNKALVHVFNKLYGKGTLTKLIIHPNKIKQLNVFYKKNFDNYSTFEEFYSYMGDLKVYLEKSPAAVLEFKKQFGYSKGLQPAVITECFIAQTVANALELDKFVDVDEKGENVPKSLAMNLLSFQGITGKAFPRYIYHNDKNDIILLQYGDSSSVDAIFIKSRESVRIEFKEQKSKLSEPDISGLYDETGKLLIDKKFEIQYSDYINLIKIFNRETSVFRHIGHNFKIAPYLDEDSIKAITEKVFNTKIIHLFILQHKNFIFPVLSENLIDCIDFSGSEIRTAGRNSLGIFTPEYAVNEITKLNGSIIDGIVKLPYQENKQIRGRNITRITRYKINNLLFVRVEDTNVVEGYIYFPFLKIKQLKPTISLHLDVILNRYVLQEEYEAINMK